MADELFVLDAWGRKTPFDPESQINFNREQLLVTVTGGGSTTNYHVDRFAGFYQKKHRADGGQGQGDMEITLRLSPDIFSTLSMTDFLSMDESPANHLMFFRGAQTLVVVNFDYFYHYNFLPRQSSTAQGSPTS